MCIQLLKWQHAVLLKNETTINHLKMRLPRVLHVTISQILHVSRLWSRMAIKKPFLRKKNIQARLQFAKNTSCLPKACGKMCYSMIRLHTQFQRHVWCKNQGKAWWWHNHDLRLLCISQGEGNCEHSQIPVTFSLKPSVWHDREPKRKFK